MLARRDDFVEHYQDGAEVALLEKYPATFVRGQGRLAGPLRVDVTTAAGGPRALEARRAVVLATGSDPLIPDVQAGLRDVADSIGAPQVIFTDPEIISVGRTESKGRLPTTPLCGPWSAISARSPAPPCRPIGTAA